MTSFSTLCYSCNGALRSALDKTLWRLLHNTLQEYKEAVSQRCFICTVLWNSLSEENRTGWAQGSASWRAMEYRVYQEENEEAIVRLEIIFQDAEKNRISDIRFRLIPPEDAEFGNTISFHHLESTTSSPSALNLIRQWCHSCHASHSRCSRLVAEKPNYPTRLIDIGGKDDTKWRLHVPSENEVLPTPYITLSYRWGSGADLMLLRSNIGEFRSGRLIRDLPQTFKDVIDVARWLSVRYIWIDALCIIQDSTEDWQLESVNMRHVYANSFCNIAASASSTPEGGLFRLRDPENVRPGFVTASFPTSEPKNYYIFDKSYWDRQILKGSLHSRGWVLQERLLAPRVIHFAEDQIFWECFTESKCEGFPHEIPLHFPLKKDFNSLWELPENCKTQQRGISIHIFNLWRDLVQEYTRCDLTKRSDKLIAISGLANLIHERTGDQYVAGLWKSRLAEYLDWRVIEPTAKIDSEYRAPSWSWASIDGRVQPVGLSAMTKMHILISEVHVENSGSNSTGPVIGGYLQLSGIIIQATTHATHDSWIYQMKTKDCQVAVQPFPDSSDIDFGEKEICCLVLKTDVIYTSSSKDRKSRPCGISVTFLILEAVSSASHTYKRIGHLVVTEKERWEKLAILVDVDGSVEPAAGSQRSTIMLV